MNLKHLTLTSLALSFALITPLMAGDPPAKVPVADTAATDATLFPVPDYTGSLMERSTLTGDWGGVRTDLANNGFQLDLSLTQIYQGVMDGGNGNNSWQYGSSIDYIFKFDFAKLGLWEGGFLQINAETYFGNNVNGNTSTLAPVNDDANYPVPNRNITAIPSIVYTQFLSERFAVFAGKLDTTPGDANSFAWGKGDERFMNTALGHNLVPVLTTPYSTLGAGMFYLLNEASLVSFNLYDPNGSATRSGFDSFFKDGVVLALETRVGTHFFDKPGHQLLGGTWSNKDYVGLTQDPRVAIGAILGLNPLAVQSGSWSAYYNFDQYLIGGENGRGFGVFGRAGFADKDTNLIEQFYSIGVGGKGICASRENDSYGVGCYYIKLSDALPGILPRSNHEQGCEVFYDVAITPWFSIGADLQFVQSPLNNIDTAIVGGIRSKIRF